MVEDDWIDINLQKPKEGQQILYYLTSCHQGHSKFRVGKFWIGRAFRNGVCVREDETFTGCDTKEGGKVTHWKPFKEKKPK